MEINDFAAMSMTRAMTSSSGKVSPMDAEYFMIATAGEAGELMNQLKKVRRGDYNTMSYQEQVEITTEELADIFTYCLLALSVLVKNPEEIIMKKYEKVNRRLAAGGFDKRPE